MTSVVFKNIQTLVHLDCPSSWFAFTHYGSLVARLYVQTAMSTKRTALTYKYILGGLLIDGVKEDSL